MISYFVRHPTAANLLMLIFVALGVLGTIGIERAVFPDFASEFIVVRVVYKGASAVEVEETICQRIEEEIEGIEGIEELTATAREGVGQIVIEVADGYEVVSILRDVENAVDQIDNFPENIEEPLIWEVKQINDAGTISLWAGAQIDAEAEMESSALVEGTITDKDLLLLADQIKNELLALDDVSLVEVIGFAEHQIRVEVREAALVALGLSITDVAREIAAQSLDLPAGSIETSEREIKIRVLDQRRRAEDFRNLAVKVGPGGARIPLSAVAVVRDTFEEDWPRTTFNGRRCVNIQVKVGEQEDTITVADAAKRYLEQRRRTLPPGVHLTWWGDWSNYVKDRLGMLVINGLYGFVLVFLTLWLLLNIRLAFWVAAGIPISFLGTMWVLHVTGMTLDMITMFSLIIALGIIVDDAIVIGENIFAHYRQGKSPARAAVDGVREVALGVTASMLTTVAVFMPLLTMQGEVGKIMRVLPVGVITALTVSLTEAFLILPNHLTHSLKKIPKVPNRTRQRIDDFVEYSTHRWYGPVIHWSTRFPLIPTAVIVMLFLVSVGMLAGGRLKFRLFPELDGDFIVAAVELPQGTDLRRTQQIVSRIEDGLLEVESRFGAEQPDRRPLIEHVSTSFGFIREVAGGPGGQQTGSHVAQVLVELLEADIRTRTCDQILQAWKQAVGDLPDVVTLTYDQMQVTPGGKAVDIQLRGRDLEQLKTASRRLQLQIAAYPGVRNLSDDLRPGKEELLVQIKKAGRPLGVASAELAAQLRGAFWGSLVQEFQRGPDSFEVEVQFADADRRSLADLHDFKVKTPSGETRPLHEVADYHLVRDFSQIVRVDRMRTVSVTADLDTAQANAAEIVDDLDRHFVPTLRAEYPDVRVVLEGQSKENAKTRDSALRGFVIGLLIIFFLLSFVFRSFLEPLIVMTAIPFGFVGAVWGHLLLGHDWTMPSTIGFISLSGIVVNDSIVLVAFIKLRLQEGCPIEEALRLAGIGRFRAVFLTSATTVAGLLPMMLETSLQAQFLIPMAVSISFGLIFATVVVLLLVPCLYSILAAVGWTQKIELDEATP
ncbi:MAG: efflux RND transporter permease subunit [Planctomycetaceae bacterium]|nr:efflux RND transporter permease subunit [Planctomycetaceae bacterium]